MAARRAADRRAALRATPLLRRFSGQLLIAPTALWMLAFFLIPLILIVLYSFGFQGVYDNSVHFTLKTVTGKGQVAYSVQSFHWYAQILTDPVYRKAFVRTTGMVLGTTLGCLLVGFPMAYTISRKARKRKTLLILLVMIPFWTSFLIRTYSWMSILNQHGLLNSLLIKLGLVSASNPLRLWPSTAAAAVTLLYGYLPFMVLPLFVSIEKIDPALIEAAKDLGAGRWTTFRKVTLPLSVPGIIAGIMLVAIPATGEFVIPGIAGGGKLVVWGWLIANDFNMPETWPLGAALSDFLLLVMLVFVIIYVRASHKRVLQ